MHPANREKGDSYRSSGGGFSVTLACPGLPCCSFPPFFEVRRWALGCVSFIEVQSLVFEIKFLRMVL